MNESIVCYGAGGAYHWVEEVLERRLGHTVIGVIDERFETLSPQFNCPVWSPSEQLEKIENQFNISPTSNLFVALGTKELCDSVAKKLSELGWLKARSLNSYFPSHLGFQVEDFDFAEIDNTIKLSSRKIDRARKLLSDDLSKLVFDQILTIYCEKSGQWVAAGCSSEMQLPPEFADHVDSSHIIRCGVDAAEISNLLGQDAAYIKTLTCYEPDPIQLNGDGSWKGLLEASYLRSTLNKETQVEIKPYAVSSEQGTASFYSSGLDPFHGAKKYSPKTSFGSRIKTKGNCTVKTTTLSRDFKTKKTSLIIIDAEGSERAIILGSIDILRQQRPTVIVAVYHKIADLWDILITLKQLNLNYRFYLRNYTGFVYETFLYAIYHRDS